MERTYTIPLRKAFLKTPKYVRTNRAVREVRMYLQHHTKSTEIRLGEELNSVLWARGNKYPPSRVTVVVKTEDEIVYAELAGKEFKKKAFSEEAADAPAKEAKAEAPKKDDAKQEKTAEKPKADKKVAK